MLPLFRRRGKKLCLLREVNDYATTTTTGCSSVYENENEPRKKERGLFFAKIKIRWEMEPAWNRIRSRNSFAWKKNSVLLPIRSGQRHHRSVYFLIGFLSSFDLLFSILCNFSTSSEASTIEGDAGFEEKTKKKEIIRIDSKRRTIRVFPFPFPIRWANSIGAFYKARRI